MRRYDKDHKIYAGSSKAPRPSTGACQWSASITLPGQQPGSCDKLLSHFWAAEWT